MIGGRLRISKSRWRRGPLAHVRRWRAARLRSIKRAARVERPHPWIRQGLACLLVFLLSARLPADLIATLLPLRAPAPGVWRAAAQPLVLLLVDGFGLVSALYLSHTRLIGVRLLSCYPPQRLIPLSLHFLGLLWGLLSLSPLSGTGGA